LTLPDANGDAPTTDGVIEYDRTAETLEVGDGSGTSIFYPTGTMTDTRYCIYTSGTGIVCDSTGAVHDAVTFDATITNILDFTAGQDIQAVDAGADSIVFWDDAGGAMDYFARLMSPLTNLIGMPAEALSVAIMRPLSGSGSLGLVSEIMQTHGPDSFIGQLVSTMYGSTETTFYVLAVYFGSVSIKRTRHAVAAGLLADIAGLLAALYICKLVFT